ncbi:MAG: hypothetical protein ACREO4_06265 [Lysobacter sp.]
MLNSEQQERFDEATIDSTIAATVALLAKAAMFVAFGVAALGLVFL